MLGRRPSGSAVRTALVFLGGIQSHAFVEKSAVEADFELWDLGQAALQAAADHLGIGADELLYARADVIGEPGHAELAELNLVAPSLGWRLLDDDARDGRATPSSRCASSQPWTGWGWVRSRIEAHSAAVAAVHDRRSGDVHRDQRRGHPGEELHRPDCGLREHRHHQHAQPHQHRPRRVHGQQPEPSPTSSAR